MSKKPTPAIRSGQYGRKCFLCGNTRHRDKNCRLFRFPARGTPMWDRWLEALGLTDAGMDSGSNASARLCQLHFQPKDFLTRQLSGMAVPVPLAQYIQPTVADADVASETLFGSSIEYIQEQPGDDVDQKDAFEDIEEVEVYDYSSIADEPECRDSCSTRFDELIDDKEPDSPEHSTCDVRQHRDLEEQLNQTRALVVQLQKENDYQKRVIEEQKNLLSGLGVHIEEELYDESPE